MKTYDWILLRRLGLDYAVVGTAGRQRYLFDINKDVFYIPDGNVALMFQHFQDVSYLEEEELIFVQEDPEIGFRYRSVELMVSLGGL